MLSSPTDPLATAPRQRLGRALGVLLALALAGCNAAAPVPEGPVPTLPPASGPLPPDALAFDSDRSGTYQVYTSRLDGSGTRALTDDARFDSWWPRLSPDRRRILFYRTPAGVHDTDYTRTSLWMMAADGSGQRELRPVGTDGWSLQGHAEWSPDGTELVMFGGGRASPQIHVTEANGRNPRALTRRGGSNLDPSWTPDGRRVVFVGCPRAICFQKNQEVYSVSVADRADLVRLTEDDLADFDPYVSPDGRRVAWLTQTAGAGGGHPLGSWNIRIANLDGSGLRRVTDDAHINSKPEWARSGSEIYFHRFEYGQDQWRLFAIEPSGRGMRLLFSDQPGHNEYPSN